MIDVKNKIQEIAEEWIGTPYMYGACAKGKGVDCARFVISVFKEAGLLPLGYQPPHQHKHWHYGKNVNKNAFVNEILKFFDKVKWNDRQVGDIVSFFFNGIESHLGIIVDNDCIIHAQSEHRVKKQRLKGLMTVCSVYRIRESE